MAETARDGGLDEVLVQDILRVITRIPLPRGQHLLLKAMLEAEDAGISNTTLGQLIAEGRAETLRGLLAAVAKRINATKRERTHLIGGQVLFEGNRARPELREAVARIPALVEALRVDWDTIRREQTAVQYQADGVVAEAAAPSPLSDDEVRTEFAAFRDDEHPPQRLAWMRAHAAALERFERLSDDELRAADVQRALWSAHDVASCGRGENLDVQAVYAVPEVVDAIVYLRRLRRSPYRTREHRAGPIQNAYDALLALVAKYTPARPQAKLTRLFAILLPEDVHTVLSGDGSRRVAVNLGITQRGLGPMQRRALTMARLEALVGAVDPAASVEERAWQWMLRARFLWSLAREDEEAEPDAAAAPATTTLTLPPFQRQFRGLVTPATADTMRRILRLALDGETENGLVQALVDDADGPRRSPKTWNIILRNARSLELLELRDGLLRPTARGDALLEDDVPDVLVEALVRRVFGIAHTLRLLEGDALTTAELHAGLRRIYPNWTTPTMPGDLLGWLRGCGLVETDRSGRSRLTDAGEGWARRLPAALPEPPPAALEPVAASAEETAPVADGALRTVPLDVVADGFDRDAEAARLVVDPDQLRLLHLAWHSQIRKRFVILSGLSGTGKTAIARAYARVVCAALGLDVKAHLEVVSVAPDWRDPAGLLGYLNPLHADPTFHVEPALLLLRHAAAHPAEPHFLVLDEMNLAPVERYFAPFLSSMETGERLRLHAADDAVNGVPPTIAWPSNLYIAGTVNMDESTYPISDKVLDRAFTLEFWDVDLARYFARRERRQSDAEGVLLALYEALRPARRHFGYRTAGEVLDLLQAGADTGLGDADRRTLLDQAVHAKVLPRLRGQETDALRAAFAEVARIAREHGLRRCGDKIAEMHDRLRHHGVTQFWS